MKELLAILNEKDPNYYLYTYFFMDNLAVYSTKIVLDFLEPTKISKITNAPYIP